MYLVFETSFTFHRFQMSIGKKENRTIVMSSNIVSQGSRPVIDSYSSYCTNLTGAIPLNILKQNERTVA